MSDLKIDKNGDLIECRFDFRKIAGDPDEVMNRIAMRLIDSCSHANAYDCAYCNERRCMTCNEPCPDTQSVKTAVRFCPAHYEDGINGRLDTYRGVQKP